MGSLIDARDFPVRFPANGILRSEMKIMLISNPHSFSENVFFCNEKLGSKKLFVINL